MSNQFKSVNLTEFLGKASNRPEIVQFMQVSGYYVTADMCREAWV